MLKCIINQKLYNLKVNLYNNRFEDVKYSKNHTYYSHHPVHNVIQLLPHPVGTSYVYD